MIETDGIRLPDGEGMNNIDETDKIKDKEMKEKFSTETIRWLRLILRSKLNERNRIMAVTWPVSVMRYSAKTLRWITDELKSSDSRTPKFMTMKEVLH